jgi:hypothetical protein
MPQLTIDREDRLHALWTSTNGLYYAYKSPNSSSWSAPVVVFAYNDPANYSYAYAKNVAPDSQGGLHVLIELSSTFLSYPISYYLHRQPDRGWQNPIPLQSTSNSQYYLGSVMAVAPDDTIHFYLGQVVFKYPAPTQLALSSGPIY